MKRRIWNRGDLRLLIVGVAFVVAWAAIGYRLFDLQGTQAVALASVGFDQRIRDTARTPLTTSLSPPRSAVRSPYSPAEMTPATVAGPRRAE